MNILNANFKIQMKLQIITKKKQHLLVFIEYTISIIKVKVMSKTINYMNSIHYKIIKILKMFIIFKKSKKLVL